ncbi:hypothetical protein [Tabrizicola thermarum]|uniref:hypothetical protein n=1 Tax=Tabrizicola thermarum TaxID=2670345 RepID=UPI000FFB5F55|nr:hypothetical protein [Tabrizicola thermarum]
MQEVKTTITKRFMEISFTEQHIAPETWKLFLENTTFSISQPPVSDRTPDARMGFQVAHQRWGHISVKPSNIRVNLTKLVTSVGSSIGGLKELSGALSILFTVLKSTVISFDQDEAAIVHAIHVHKISLPKDSASLYRIIEPMVSKYVTFDRYMEKLPILAQYGAISIDGDQVKITEGYLRLD